MDDIELTRNIFNRQGIYYQLLEEMPEGFVLNQVVYDNSNNPVNFKIIDVNSEFERMSEIKKEYLINKKISEILPDPSITVIEKLCNVAITGKRTEFNYYYDVLNKYFNIKAFAFNSDIFALLISDITANQNYQNELFIGNNKIKESESKYKSLIESSGYLFIYIDKELKIQTFNTLADKLYRHYYSMPLKAGTDIKILFDALKLNLSLIESALIGSDSSMELITEENNRIKYIEIIIKPVYGLENTVTGVVLTGKDITERKETELSVKYSEEKLKTIFDIIPIGIILTNYEGRYIYLNSIAQELLNFSLDDDESKNITPAYWKFVNPQYEIIQREEYPSYKSLINREIIFNKEMGLVGNEGSIKWLSVSSAPIPIPNYGVVLALKDITESFNSNETNRILIQDLYESRQSIEENANEIISLNIELEEQAEKLKTLNQTKDKFFSIISHDLKNPLAGFMQITQILINDIYKMSIIEIKEVLDTLHVSADNIYKLLTNLLDWSKTQTGGIQFIPANLPLNYLIENTVELISIMAKNKDIDIEFDKKDSIRILADASMFLTVIRNLLSNAIKFTVRGGNVRIWADYYYDNPDFAVVCIEDTGIGISKDDINQLFKLSSSLGKVGTENEPSTGLGLILCKEFINKNGGNIWAESQVGMGSKFYFTIPVFKE